MANCTNKAWVFKVAIRAVHGAGVSSIYFVKVWSIYMLITRSTFSQTGSVAKFTSFTAGLTETSSIFVVTIWTLSNACVCDVVVVKARCTFVVYCTVRSWSFASYTLRRTWLAYKVDASINKLASWTGLRTCILANDFVIFIAGSISCAGIALRGCPWACGTPCITSSTFIVSCISKLSVRTNLNTARTTKIDDSSSGHITSKTGSWCARTGFTRWMAE